MKEWKEKRDESFNWILDGFREGESKCYSCWLPYLVGFTILFILVLSVVVGMQKYKVKELTSIYDAQTTD